jgi:hypothetical protein
MRLLPENLDKAHSAAPEQFNSGAVTVLWVTTPYNLVAFDCD